MKGQSTKFCEFKIVHFLLELSIKKFSHIESYKLYQVVINFVCETYIPRLILGGHVTCNTLLTRVLPKYQPKRGGDLG